MKCAERFCEKEVAPGKKFCSKAHAPFSYLSDVETNLVKRPKFLKKIKKKSR